MEQRENDGMRQQNIYMPQQQQMQKQMTFMPSNSTDTGFPAPFESSTRDIRNGDVKSAYESMMSDRGIPGIKPTLNQVGSPIISNTNTVEPPPVVLPFPEGRVEIPAENPNMQKYTDQHSNNVNSIQSYDDILSHRNNEINEMLSNRNARLDENEKIKLRDNVPSIPPPPQFSVNLDTNVTEHNAYTNMSNIDGDPENNFRTNGDVENVFTNRIISENANKIQKSQIIEREYYVTIDSRDRDRTVWSNPNNYAINFQGSSNSSIGRVFKNVKSIKLISAQFPYISDFNSTRYITLEIEEIGSVSYGTNITLSKAFAKLKFEDDSIRTLQSNVGKFVSPDIEDTSKIYKKSSLGHLNKMTILFRKPDGSILSFGSDYLASATGNDYNVTSALDVAQGTDEHDGYIKITTNVIDDIWSDINIGDAVFVSLDDTASGDTVPSIVGDHIIRAAVKTGSGANYIILDTKVNTFTTTGTQSHVKANITNVRSSSICDRLQNTLTFKVVTLEKDSDDILQDIEV